ncbi:putative holin-like toxin [Paenibacillus daejeonensis]|nr:putative holin-like toxin [Paenibacillus daejeonensis]
MEVKDALTIMIAFGALIVSLIGLVINVVLAITNKKK